jgi:hypothetical protein
MVEPAAHNGVDDPVEGNFSGTGVISMNRRTKRRIEVQSLPDTTSLKVILAILLLSIAACGATIASTLSGG